MCALLSTQRVVKVAPKRKDYETKNILPFFRFRGFVTKIPVCSPLDGTLTRRIWGSRPFIRLTRTIGSCGSRTPNPRILAFMGVKYQQLHIGLNSFTWPCTVTSFLCFLPPRTYQTIFDSASLLTFEQPLKWKPQSSSAKVKTNLTGIQNVEKRSYLAK